MSTNAKMPDEIKTGVELCTTKVISGNLKTCDLDCPYRVEGVWCRNALSHDTLAYIQQLEADNAQQARCIENLTDKLNATNDALPRWISVEERVPEQGERVLFYTAGNRTVYIGRYLYTGLKGAVWFSTQTSSHMRNGGTYTASHWMPLPEPPEVRI